MRQLYESLQQAGEEPIILGNKILVLPFAGRILGLYPDMKTNQFWVNESISDAESARSFLDGEGWLNIGGDRTWISPEMETHTDDMNNYPDNIDVPKAVDPGAYRVKEVDNTAVTLESDMDVNFHQSKKHIKMNLKKQVVMMDNPPLDLPEKVEFAGYCMNSSLKVVEQVTGNMRPGLWKLIQVPGGGEIFVPVKQGVEPRAFIGKPEFSLANNLVKCRVETDSSYKFSIKAGYSKGLMIYINTEKEPASLVVRKFKVEDESLFADYSCLDPSDDGYMTEIYIDDGMYGGFGELEYHSPAIHVGKGENEVNDSSETWGFSGPAKEIKELCDSILKDVS